MSPQPDALAEDFRQQQLGLRAVTLQQLLGLWPMLDPARVTDTFPSWALSVSSVVTQNRLASAGLAGQYVKAQRSAAGVPGAVQVVSGGALPPEQFVTSLRVTSVVALRAAARQGAALDEAMRSAFVQSSGAMSRLVLEGGRQTVEDTTAADPKAKGWYRKTSARPCHFCAMLATRGAVYHSRESAQNGSRGRYHDHCSCVAVPVYGDYAEPDHVKAWRELYESSTSGKSGKDAMNAFRRAYERGT